MIENNITGNYRQMPYLEKFFDTLERNSSENGVLRCSDAEKLVFEYSTRDHLHDMAQIVKAQYQVLGEKYGTLGKIGAVALAPVTAAAFDFGVTMLKSSLINGMGFRNRYNRHCILDAPKRSQ